MMKNDLGSCIYIGMYAQSNGCGDWLKISTVGFTLLRKHLKIWRFKPVDLGKESTALMRRRFSMVEIFFLTGTRGLHVAWWLVQNRRTWVRIRKTSRGLGFLEKTTTLHIGFGKPVMGWAFSKRQLPSTEAQL